MAVTNDDIMAELKDIKQSLATQQAVWKRAKGVAEHFDVSLGTVKSWKKQGLIKGQRHNRTVIYDVMTIKRELFTDTD
ncbi:hypothetical protein [Leuconostoc pseudomesenteroides]|uniref:hypothetical protein n=1 Tax=Leuconostoc pseudomesenteroides TaxID=33968 RepID=UPI0032DFE1F5